MSINLTRILLGLGLLTAIVLSSASSRAQAPAKQKKSYYKGKIISYDAERKLLRIANGKQSVTLVVEPNVPLQIDSMASTKKVADLPADSYISVLLNADKTAGLEVNALGPLVMGTIDAIDLENNKLQSVDKKKNPSSYVFAPNVPVTIDKTTGKVEEIKVGAQVQMKLSFDKSKALSIRVLRAK